MTAQHDLDRALATWFDGDAKSAPPEPLARILETTRAIRPRPALTAWVGSHRVGARSTGRLPTGLADRRPAVVMALVALLTVALVGAALLVGSRLLVPTTPPRVYLDEFTPAADLSMPMAWPALVPLLDGRVLVIGDDGDGGGRGTRALVYDPDSGSSESTGPLVNDDTLQIDSAVRLKDGKVLVFGNHDEGDAVTQIFDPATRQFTSTGPMVTPRIFGAAVAVLPDGHVLVAGGYPSGEDAATSSAELFDPDTLTYSPTGSMMTSRASSSLAVLPDGRVFMSPGESRTTAEVYDPRTGSFSPAGTMASYGFGLAMALPDGRVVVLGGSSLGNHGMATIWDPTTLVFTPERALPGWVTRAVLLDDGRVLLVGGGRTNWSGIYNPTGGGANYIDSTRAWAPRATRLADGRVLIVGGLADGDLRPEGGGTMAPGVTTVEIFQ